MNAIEEVFKILGTNANSVAKEMGITRHTIYDWINGRRAIPKDRVSHLSELLQVPQYLLTKEDKLDRSDKLLLLEIYSKSILGEDDYAREPRMSFEYDVPIQEKEKCEEINKALGTDFKSTEEHMEILIKKICDGIYEIGDAGGWYLQDGIKVRVEIEYDPENK